MQQRKTLRELAIEVLNTKETKRDYVVPSRKIYMDDECEIAMDGVDTRYGTGVVAHEQIGTKLGIPKKYYDKMYADDKSLLAYNVNAWLRKDGSNRMVRTYIKQDRPTMRAFLSDSYLPIDNDAILNTILSVMDLENDYQVVSSEVTDRRMYMSVVSPRLEGEVRKGEVVQCGMMFGNSEVGLGSFFARPFIYILSCLNGAVMDYTLRKYHVGGRIEESLDAYSSDTVKVNQLGFLMRVRDVVQSSFNDVMFYDMLGKMKEAVDRKITNVHLDDVAVNVTEKFNLTINEKDNMLMNLVNGKDFTQFGVSQSITMIANDLEDYDRAVELQTIGGKVVNLSGSEWNKLNGGV